MRKRGIALVLVLTMMSVVMLLMGAFMTANRANFTALGATQRQREAQFAAESAIHFAWYQLAHNQFWGKQPFSDSTEISMEAAAGPGLRVWRVAGPRASIRGRVVDENGSGREATFTLAVWNNLANDSPNGDLPADSARLEVVGTSGSFTVRSSVLLTGAPIYSASLTANRTIELNSDRVSITSEDDMRNWVRSNEDIYLPDFVGGGARLNIETRPGAPKGVIWAQGDIVAGSRVLKNELIGEANNRSGGLLTPKSRLKHDIYKLEMNDLKIGANSVTEDQRTSLEGGEYIVSNSVVRYTDLAGQTHQHGCKVLRHVHNGRTTIYYDSQWLSNPVFPNEPGAVLKPSDQAHLVELGSGPNNTPAMTYDFTKNEFTAVSSATIQVDGDLSIYCGIGEGEGGQMSDAAERASFEPKINLETGGDSKGVIRATGGIKIQGSLSGGGGLLAKDDIWLMSNSQTDTGQTQVALEADTSQGVVLYGKNIHIAAGNTQEINFKGLIYAENDVNVHGGLQVLSDNGQLSWESSDIPLRKLQLEGAVVAHSGSIRVTHTNELIARYNEKYLKQVTKGLYSTQGVATVGFRKLEKLWVHED